MFLEVELEFVNYISKSVLYSIIYFYVWVCLFLLVKDIIECYKIKVKKSKVKFFCKEISRSCDD